MLTEQEMTADASSLNGIMSPRGRKNLPVVSLTFSSAEVLTIPDKYRQPAKAELETITRNVRGSRGEHRMLTQTSIRFGVQV